MRTPPYRLNEVTCTPNGTLHRLPSTSRNCRKRLRLAMRDSADADSVVQTQADTGGRSGRKGTSRVHHSAHAVFELLVAVTGPFAVLCWTASKKQTATRR
jgi:hypothetical protein